MKTKYILLGVISLLFSSCRAILKTIEYSIWGVVGFMGLVMLFGFVGMILQEMFKNGGNKK